MRLKPNEIIAADYEQGPSSSDDSALEFTLHLRTQSRHYTSFSDTNSDDMQQTLRRIKEMQGR